MKYRIEIETLEVQCDFLSETAELLKPENWERLTVTRLDADEEETE